MTPPSPTPVVLADLSRPTLARDLFAVARPHQWIKNLVCFAALIFAGQLPNLDALGRSIIAFAALCLASSAIYIFNDIRDREADRLHPRKRLRPLAAGRLSVGAAAFEAALAAAGAMAVSCLLVERFRWVVVAFMALNVLYSLALKHVPVLDVMGIALGFVLRVQAGIEAIQAPQSAWVILCMFSMALFLGFGKRRGELVGQETGSHRRSLSGYSIAYLDILLGVSATNALVCYSLYAVTVQRNETFLLTILPVTFGIVRYLMLVIVGAEGEGPDELLISDVPLVAAVTVWTVLCVSILYFGLRLFPGAPVR